MTSRTTKETLLGISILAGSAGITALSNELVVSGTILCVFCLALVALRGYLKSN